MVGSLTFEEMVLFLFDDFGMLVDTSTVSRALKTINWSKEKMRQIARERNADLRDFYLHKYHLFHRGSLSTWTSQGATSESAAERRDGLLVE